MADAYARMTRPGRGADRAPGLRADQRDDRHRRGGQEPHAAARAGGRGDAAARRTSTSTRTRWRGPSARSPMRITSAETAVDEAVGGGSRQPCTSGAPSLLNLPLDGPGAGGAVRLAAPATPPAPAAPVEPERRGPGAARGRAAGGAAAGVRRRPRRPVGPRGTPQPPLAGRCGALLATSAVAKGLFHDDPWSLDVSGGFASPLAAELIGGADLIVGWGCALNMWTMRHGRLIADGRDGRAGRRHAGALGAQRDAHLRRLGDVGATARAALACVRRTRPPTTTGYRTDDVRRRIAGASAGATCPYDDASGDGPHRPAHADASRSTTCSRPSASSASTRATSWATRACSCPCPTSRASASPRRSSRSGSGWPPRSAPRSPARTGCRWPRSATVAA